MNGKSAPIVAAAIVLGFGLLLTGCTGPASHAEHSGRAPGPTDAGKGQTNKDTVTGNVTVDAKLPSYKTVGGVSDELKSIGSDTMNNLMALWAEGFKKKYPNVEVEVEGKGSATGSAGADRRDRPVRPDEPAEMKQARDRRLREEVRLQADAALPTSIDMLAVYVHKDNPIKSLTLQQVDAIFSKTRKAGYDKDITHLGRPGPDRRMGRQADQPLSAATPPPAPTAFSRNTSCSTATTRTRSRSSRAVPRWCRVSASDKYAIGYSGIGYKTADVRAVPLAKNARSQADRGEPRKRLHAAIIPLARFLYIYVNYKPNSELDPLRREFIKYIFSKEGQQDVIKDGYLPDHRRRAHRGPEVGRA